MAEGTYIAATGGKIPAGQPIAIELSGLPHHSVVPSSIALALAVMIVVGGVWTASRPRIGDEAAARVAETKEARRQRDKLFNDLVRLEHDRRSGRADERRYATRREEIVAGSSTSSARSTATSRARSSPIAPAPPRPRTRSGRPELVVPRPCSGRP